MKCTRIFMLTAQGVLLAGLSGCGWLMGEEGLIKDRREEYREAVVTDVLKLPAGTDTQALGELYEIPGAEQPRIFESDKFKVPRPDTQVASRFTTELRAFKSGSDYWVVLDGEPGDVWGRVRRFWDVNDIELGKEVPSQGLMETTWLTREYEGKGSRDKFRTRVEHGLQKGVSEVHIAHLGYDIETPEIPAEQLDWSQLKTEDPITLAMLQELSSFLVQTKTSTAPASLLAQKFEGRPKSSLNMNDKGEGIIALRLSYSRAWNAVGKAIEAAGFELEDRDRDAGRYEVIINPADAEEEGGFFSFLSFGDDEIEPYHIGIQVEPSGDQVQAFITEYDEKVTVELRNEILTRIKRQLI